MALTRLHDLIESAIYDYYDPDHLIRKPPREMFVKTSKASLAVSKVYTRRNTLTIFADAQSIDDQVSDNGMYLGKSLDPIVAKTHNKSLGTATRIGKSSHADHEQMHRTKTDYDLWHTHIIKGQQTPQQMTADEIKCIFNLIKEYEKKNDACLDGKTNCLLADSDLEQINNQYADFLRAKNRAKILEKKVGAAFAALDQHFLAGIKSYAIAFISTFLDKYLKPLLITNNINPNQATWAVELAKSGLTLAFSSSLLNMALATLLRNLLTPVLTQLGINVALVERISTDISAVVACIDNPLSLIELSMLGTSAAVGQQTAYELIRLLPKLKTEPELVLHSDDAATSVAENADTQSPVSLRRRNVTLT